MPTRPPVEVEAPEQAELGKTEVETPDAAARVERMATSEAERNDLVKE